MRTDNRGIQYKTLKRCLKLGIIFLFDFQLAQGQAVKPSLPTQRADRPPALAGRRVSAPVPLHLLYRHFLAYQNHLDEVAATLQQQGEDGNDFRNHFQQMLGFSPTEYTPVRRAAQRLEAKLKVHDEKIKAVIDTGRAQHSRILGGPGDLPAPPPELVQLQVERDALIKHEVARMNSTLGAKRAAKVQRLIEEEFAAHAKLLPLHSPTVSDPAKSPLSPFPNGVQ